MSDKKGVAVKIIDREYRIACEPEERRMLLDAADYLDRQMRQIREGANMVSMDKVAVLAALNIASELLQLKQREEAFGEEVGNRIRTIRRKLDAAMEDEEA